MASQISSVMTFPKIFSWEHECVLSSGWRGQNKDVPGHLHPTAKSLKTQGSVQISAHHSHNPHKLTHNHANYLG